MKENLQKKL